MEILVRVSTTFIYINGQQSCDLFVVSSRFGLGNRLYQNLTHSNREEFQTR